MGQSLDQMPDLKKMYVAGRKIFLVKPSMPEKKEMK